MLSEFTSERYEGPQPFITIKNVRKSLARFFLTYFYSTKKMIGT